MFTKIAAFELRYQLKSPVFWIGFLIFFLLAFGATTMEEIQIGARGNVYVNSPYAIVQTLAVMGVMGIFVITAFVAGAVIRDDETGFAPILRATRVSKAAYVFGRFAGATLVAFIVMSSVALGMQLGSFMPWIDPEKLGPQVPWHYVWALLVVMLPTVLVVSAMFFALATATRSLMWTYVGAVGFLVLFIVMRALTREPTFDSFSALSDPFAVSALSQAAKYWTATERNAQMPDLQGALLLNRAIWFAVSAGFLALAYRIFRMDGSPLLGRRRAPAAPTAIATEKAALTSATTTRTPLPQAQLKGAALAQFLAIARFDAAAVFKSPAFFVLMAIGVLNAFAGLWFSSRLYGTEIYPVTRVMVQALEGSFSMIPFLMAVFYAGELVWRDRQQRMHEIVDATAVPDWVHLLPKIAAVIGVLFITSLVGVLTAMFFQVVRGYFDFQLPQYLVWYVLPQTITAALLAVLAVFVQTLVPGKMIGWAVMLVYFVSSIALNAAGFEHNLYQYAGVPQVPISVMNGLGHFWIGRAWFQLYWTLGAVVLALLAHLLRRRGAETRLAPRLRQLPTRLRGPAGAVLALSLVGMAATGAWIFHNTNVLNEYLTLPETDARLAGYEKALLAFEKLPQPRITDVSLDVQLFPQERRATTVGSYVIENRTGAPLTHVHVRWLRPLRMTKLELPGATIEKDYKEYAYRIYRLAPTMAAGEKRTLSFTSELKSEGFGNARSPFDLVDNGSFINNFQVAPIIGMSRAQLLQDRNKRRKQGLEPELRMAKLEDEKARANHYLRNDSDWVQAQITLGTDVDQVPVAPGATVSDTTAGGRRTLVTRTEAPIQHFFSMQSARYSLKTQAHQGTALSVYHAPQHAYNVQRMLDAMAASVELFSASFSPYQFKQARILEFPAYADFAQAFAGTMPYSEGIGFVIRHRDDEKIDMVTYVTAHEVGHQWWAHQIIGADMQGSTMLSETFAQYAALLVMEKLYGRDQIRRFLKYELDRYLRARGGELIEEQPLVRVENQPYIHYQKGSLVMYWLKEVVGEKIVNRALQRMLETYAFKPAPYPSSADFLRVLRDEAGPAHDALITDLFERIVLFDAKCKDAQATRRADGRWELTLTLEARKLVADGKGKEREEPLDEAFDIGVFSGEPGSKGFTQAAVLLMERRPIKSGVQTLKLLLDKQPAFAGIDPYNKRIDRNSDDNVKAVSVVK